MFFFNYSPYKSQQENNYSREILHYLQTPCDYAVLCAFNVFLKQYIAKFEVTESRENPSRRHVCRQGSETGKGKSGHGPL